jgi:hypothetical protein
MLREPQHDDSMDFWGVILSLPKDLGVMQSSPLTRGARWVIFSSLPKNIKPIPILYSLIRPNEISRLIFHPPPH